MSPNRLARGRFFRRTLIFGVLLAAGTAVLGTGLALGAEVQPTPAVQASTTDALPLFAYYDTSGNDAALLRRQIAQAEAAGIQGWIVDWKNTALDDSRLKLLMRVAARQDFKLAMIYQSLDSDSDPLPESEVARDFQTFETRYASDPVFSTIGGKALTIWNGTWGYTPAQVRAVTAPVRGGLLVLGTQRSVASYDRIARYTDGDAYSWSPANTRGETDDAAELEAMAAAVHGEGGYWLASFAPGPDAEPAGGTGTMSRDDGQTLRAEYAAAVASSPDMLGLISWNELGESPSAEPSNRYGGGRLNAVAALRDAAVPVGELDQDSSSSGGVSGGRLPDALVSAGAAGLFAGFLGLLVAGRSRRRRTDPEHKEHGV